ncbi:MAG TPA: YgaP-like transmembrane domain [Polyangium sp.]|nr:YgaP-like transmembrane domain [Polyangium sp.]
MPSKTPRLDDIHGIPAHARRMNPLNVGPSERVVSTALGGGLVAWGLWRRGALGLLAGAVGGALAHRGVRGHCPAYAALGMSSRNAPTPMPLLQANLTRIERTVTVARPANEVYAFLRDPAHVPHFAPHVERVEDLGAGSLRVWTSVDGERSSWEAHIDLDHEARAIVLGHAEGPPERLAILLGNAPGGRGTEIRLVLELSKTRGLLLRALAAVAGADPDAWARAGLRRLKMLLEAGEIVTTEGQPSGRLLPVMHAA